MVQFVTASGETRVNTTVVSDQLYPTVAALGDGGWVVTWTSFQDGSASEVYQQRYNTAGATVGTETRVNTSTFGSQEYPTVTALGDGGWVVTWTSSNLDGSGFGVYQQRYNAAGATVGTETRVNTGINNDQVNPSVTALGDGGWVVTWMSLNQDAPGQFNYGVYQQRYNAAGAAVGTETRVNTTTTDQQQSPTVTVLGDGGWVVTWMSNGQDGSGWGVYQQRYNATGATVGTETRVNTTTADQQQFPTLTALADGGWVVTWQSTNQDGSGSGVYQQRYNAAGATVGSETRVNTTTTDQQQLPTVTALGDGGWVVTWQSTNQDGSGYGVYQQRYNAAGATVGTEIRVNHFAINDQRDPTVTALADGSWVVTWMSNGQDGTGYGVYQQRYSAAGTLVAMASDIELVTGTSGDDFIAAEPGGLNAGDQVDGGGGLDTIALTSPGAMNLSAATTIRAVERVLGSDGVDTITVSADALTDVESINGGDGYDTLVISGAVIDLSGVAISGIERITPASSVTTEIRISDFANAALVDGTVGEVRIIVTDETLTAEQRATLFGAGVDHVTDQSGLTIPATGADARFGTETRVNTVTNSDQRDPTVTALADGGWVVTWQSTNQDGSGSGVYQQRYNAAGATIGIETRVNTTTTNQQQLPTVTALGDGGWVVTWMSNFQDGSGQGVYQQRYNAAGATVGTETRVNTVTNSDQLNPTVTALADGGWVVTWQSTNQDGSGSGVYQQRYNGAGATIGIETRVNTTTTNQQQLPTVTALGDGGWVVTWMSFNQDGSGSGVYQQRYNAAGATVGTETRVNTVTNSDQLNPTVTALGDGGWVVTWMSFNQDGSGYGVYQQRYNAAGATVGIETRVNTTTFVDQRDPTITALADGGWVVTWMSGLQDGSGFGVYQQRYNAMGATAGTETLVNTVTADSQEYPVVAGLADGSWVVTWTSNTQDSSGWGVYQQRFQTIDYTVLTLGPDTVDGTDDDTLIVTTPSNLDVADSLSGGLGDDVIEMEAAGTLDLTAPAILDGFERVLGTSGDDTFVVSQARLADLTSIEGRGGIDTLTTEDASLNLTGKTLIDIEVINSTNPDGTAFTVDDIATALLVDGATGAADSVTLAGGGIFSEAQREQLFSQGIESLTDASGTYAPNDAPAVTGPVTLVASPEDMARVITLAQLLANASDVDGDTLDVANLAASSGTLVDNNDGTWTFTPAANDDTGVTFTYDVVDGQGGSTPASASLDLTSVNDAPVVAVALIDQVAQQDQPFTFVVPAETFSDVDGNALSISATLANGDPLPAWLTFNALDQTFSGTPGNADVGVLQVAVTVFDGALSVSDTFALNVGNANDAPTVTGPVTLVASPEDTARVITLAQLLANASDVDGDTLDVANLAASSGTLVDNNDGTWTFTPAANDDTGVTFTYDVVDGQGGSTPASASLDLTSVNDAPVVAVALIDQVAQQDQPFTFVVPAETFSDVDGNALSISATLANGDPLPAWLTFNALDQTFSGTPGNADVGVLQVAVTVFDGALSVSDTFALNVGNANDAPTVTGPVTLVASPEDTARVITLAQLLANASDVDGDTLDVANLAASSGTLVDNNDGTWTFTPAANDDTGVTFTYDVVDGQGGSTPASASLDLTSVNDAPVVAVALIDQVAQQDQPFTFVVPAETFSDVDGNALSISATLANGDPLPAWLTFNALDQTFSGTPGNADVGVLQVAVTVFDGALSVSDTFALNVGNANDAPTVTGPVTLVASPEDTARVITLAQLLANASDVDGDTLDVANLAASSGTLVDNNDGTWTFTPAANDDTGVTFTYDVVDGQGGSTPASASLDLTSVNDAPVVAVALIDQVAQQDQPFTFVVPAGTFSDVDGNALSISATLANGDPLPAWLTFNALDQTFSGTPGNADVGVLQVAVTVFDGALSVSDTFALNVGNANDAPTVTGPVTLVASPEDTARVITLAQLLANASDVDGDTLDVANLAASSGSLVDNNDGTWTFTPAANDDTGVTFTYDVVDGQGGSTPASASLDLTSVNDAPTELTLTNASVAENAANGTVIGSLSATDADESDTATFSIVGDPDGKFGIVNGQLVVAGALDFEAKAQHNVTVRATDTGGLMVDRTFMIAVTDIFEQPPVPTTGVTITGGAANDTINVGSSAPSQPLPTLAADLINANGGDDFIDGLGGADTINGGIGNDTIVYRPDAAIINGASGRDTLVLMSSDVINLINGPDQSQGTPVVTGMDDVDGSSAVVALTVTGNIYNNTLRGGGEGDVIGGDAGRDVLDGGGGNDTLTGGEGNDTIVGGSGIDRALYTGTRANYQVTQLGPDQWTVRDLRSGSPEGTDAVSGVELLVFSDQTLALNPVTNNPPTLATPIPDQATSEDAPFTFTLPSGTFADADGDPLTLTATLTGGGALPAWLTFNAATRTFSGTPGDANVGDLAIVVRATDPLGATVSDTFILSVANLNEAPTDIALTNASVAESGGPNTVIGTLSAVDPDLNDTTTFTLIGDPDDKFDVVNGQLVLTGALDFETKTSHAITVRVTDSGGLTYEEAFTINVTDVDESPPSPPPPPPPATGVTINGSSGNDTIGAASTAPGQPLPTLAADTIFGNDGNDVIDGRGGADTILGGVGDDRIVYRSDAANLNGASGRDVLVMLSTDTINLGVADQSLGTPVASGFDDVDASGLSASISITGNGSNNTLIGGTAADTINGGAGVDVIAGSLGDDTLTGGAGKDFFVFDTTPNATNNVDTITDFVVVDDTIRLENAVFTAFAATGNLAGAAFATGVAATTAAHRIVYDPFTGEVRYDADGSGAGQSILFAKLGTGLSLTSGDFVII